MSWNEFSSNWINVLCCRATFARGVVMWLVSDEGFDWETQTLFVLLPYRHDSVLVLAVARPDGYFIPLWPDIDHSSTHVFTGLIKGLSD